MQLEYSNRCPSLIRRVLSSGTFAEGWAVYTEQMMLDQGFGGGDLGLRLQQLKFYLRAVVNAILDHKMHAGKMTDAEAMDLLVRPRLPDRGRGGRQDHPGQADVLPAFDLFRRPHGLLSLEAADSARAGGPI